MYRIIFFSFSCVTLVNFKLIRPVASSEFEFKVLTFSQSFDQGSRTTFISGLPHHHYFYFNGTNWDLVVGPWE